MDMQVLDQLEPAYRRGEYGRVIYTCDQLLANPAYDPHRAIILFWKGLSKERASQAWRGEAISCLREAMAAASNDRPTKARIMVALGMIYAYMGDYAAFEKLIKEWERISRDKNPDVMKWGAPLWFNYGCTLDNACRYGEAIAVYKRALTLCTWAEEHRGRVLHNLGGACLYSGTLSEAKAAMDEAEPLYGDEPNTLSRRAEYALAVSDLPNTQQYITEALLHAHVEDDTRAVVYLTWAQLLLALDQPQKARETALKALDYAIRSVSLPAIHKANLFLQRLAPDGQ
ncbi:MAG TPA: tetratricopeptide repeat protein [Candidatus Sulfotelmatobacter sp.]|nr:tetratricopeptide repeat protein [Candidatus Sulfotelmatobacter sp.]